MSRAYEAVLSAKLSPPEHDREHTTLITYQKPIGSIYVTSSEASVELFVRSGRRSTFDHSGQILSFP